MAASICHPTKSFQQLQFAVYAVLFLQQNVKESLIINPFQGYLRSHVIVLKSKQSNKLLLLAPGAQA